MNMTPEHGTRSAVDQLVSHQFNKVPVSVPVSGSAAATATTSTTRMPSSISTPDHSVNETHLTNNEMIKWMLPSHKIITTTAASTSAAMVTTASCASAAATITTARDATTSPAATTMTTASNAGVTLTGDATLSSAALAGDCFQRPRSGAKTAGPFISPPATSGGSRRPGLDLTTTKSNKPSKASFSREYNYKRLLVS